MAISVTAWIELAASLFCLGTWPALLELGRSGGRRSQEHAFLDCALLYALSALALLFIGEAAGSDDKIFSASQGTDDGNLLGQLTLISFAAVGGGLLMLGNACLQAALALGCPLTTLLPLQASLCVCIGTSLNFCLQPSMSNPAWLFSGVAAYLFAIGFSASAQMKHQVERAREYERQQLEYGNKDAHDDGEEGVKYSENPAFTRGEAVGGKMVALVTDVEAQQEGPGASPELSSSAAATAGAVRAVDPSMEAASFEIAPGKGVDALPGIQSDIRESLNSSGPSAVETRDSELRAKRKRGGLMTGAMGGVAFGGFAPALNVAVNDPFGLTRDPSRPLSVGTANMIFATTFVISAVFMTFMKLKEQRRGRDLGTGLIGIAADYFRDGGRARQFSLASGLICSVGNFLQFDAGKRAGFAVAGLVQAFPVVGTVWGVVLFSDYKGASRRVALLLACVYFFYLLAAAFIGLSAV